jgi:hypothetical protein
MTAAEPRARLKQQLDALVRRRRMYVPSDHYAECVEALHAALSSFLSGDESPTPEWLERARFIGY